MEGFDPGWIDNGNQAEISYTRLPPGDYVFRARPAIAMACGNPQELRLPVRVARPVWRHPVALVAYAAGWPRPARPDRWQLYDRRRRERDYFAQIGEREERLKLALWASGEQFWDYDLQHGSLHSMRAAQDGSDEPGIEVHGEIEQKHEIHPEDLPRVQDRLRQHLRGEASLFLSEHRIRAPHGGWAWVRARGRVVERNAEGRALRVAGTARDISASRNAERERRIAIEVLRSMTRRLRSAIAISIRLGQPGVQPNHGYGDAEVIGRSQRARQQPARPDFYR
jgi:PAS domain-containing protein